MKLPERTRRKKLELQHNKCYYCGLDFTENTKTEIDHILPFSKYHDSSNKNLCISCKECNRQKSNKSIKEFRKLLNIKNPNKLIRGLFYFEFLNLENK